MYDHNNNIINHLELLSSRKRELLLEEKVQLLENRLLRMEKDKHHTECTQPGFIIIIIINVLL